MPNCGGSAIDQRTTRHEGYAISQRKRKRIEESFGWLKTIALMRKVRHRGIQKVGWLFTFAAAAYNLVRMEETAGQLNLVWHESGEKCACPRPKREIKAAVTSTYAPERHFLG